MSHIQEMGVITVGPVPYSVVQDHRIELAGIH